MLLTGSELMSVARKHKFAIPAFNISDYSMLNAVLDISVEKRSPVFLAIHPNEINNLGWDVMPSIIQAARKRPVPMAIHWDHGADYTQIIQAIQGGFTSVMIDGSVLPFEENVALTAKVVEAARAAGVSVEGELGTIGKTDDAYGEGGTDDILYTVPEEAVQFVQQTGVDSLAVAIGTRHGIYPDHLRAELKLDLLREIAAVVDIPLVLHGGSNNPDAEIHEAAISGVNKVNLSSDLKIAYYNKAREILQDGKLREPDAIQPPCREALKVVAAQKMDLLESSGKADLY